MVEDREGAAVAAGSEPRGLPSGWSDNVLGFWFGQHGKQDWFFGSPAFDDEIKIRFAGLIEAANSHSVDTFLVEGRTVLAAIILFDQFPRNLFRDSAKQFAFDAKALALAKASIDRGDDRTMSRDERLFLYLPFEHSEALSDQDRAVELISALGDEAYTEFAEKHRDVIRRFGRFPHRNGMLGRTSTEAEVAFLVENGRGF